MAAYAAVISLKHTLNGLLHSSRISLIPSTREILESAYNETTSLQQVLERSNDCSRSKSSNERLEGLEGQIRDFAHQLEDVLEFHELNHYEDDEEVVMRQEITSFVEAVKKVEKDYIEELSRNDDADDTDDEDLSRFDFGVEMVGRSSDFTMIRRYLLNKMRPDDLLLYALLGEEGTGRTVTAKTIFENARNASKQIFDCFVWLRVGPKHKLKEVMIRIIAQVDNLAAEADYESLISQEDEKLSKHLYKLLEHRRYMIVLDDVDDVELVNQLKTKSSFPDQSNGSVVFLTTASNEVALLADTTFKFVLPPSYFEEYLWIGIRGWILNCEAISEEMEVAGKKIIRNCRCLVISFAKTFLFLSKSERTVEQWSKIAADEQNPIFMVADEISQMRQIKREMQYGNREIVEKILPLVQFSDEVVKVKMQPERFFSRMQIISFFGMAGIGKTTFVRNFFKDKLVISHFDRRVWITLGPKYHKEEILLDILAQIYPHIHKLHMKKDEKLIENMCQELSSKRCLIVLDDLCSQEPLLHLRNLFPDIRGITG